MNDHRTRAASVARRDQIVAAATMLLAERGYQATTFDAIREYAALSSKRLITYHFHDKRELFAAVADRVVSDAERFMRPAIDAAGHPGEVLDAVIRASVAFNSRHPHQMKALQQLILGGDRAWERHHNESLRRLAELFALGQRTGNFREHDPRIMAAALRASIDSVSGPLAAGLDPDHCADQLADLFHRAVRPDHPERDQV